MARNTDIDADVLVVGGGLVGASLAGVLAASGVPTALVDREDPEAVLKQNFDGRASAIAAGSRHMFEAVGLWDHVPACQPIHDIRVTDGRVGERPSPLALHYDHRVVGEAMGHLVENRHLRVAQKRFLATLDTLHHVAPVEVARVVRRRNGVEARLQDGRRIRARLVAACDGRGSRLRTDAGIRTRRWHYDQSAIVTTLAHERPHRGTAYEHFLPAGPFAMLPLPDAADGTHRSSIVWTETHAMARKAMDLDEAAFAREIRRRFGDTHGDVRSIAPRFRYPLSGLHADRYIDRRMALVGDSAHAIHPIAGQGLNLGLRDVAALAECVVDARRLGLDVGANDVLRRYQRWRRPDNLTLVAATDSLDRLFSNDVAPVRLARDLGLAAVNRMGPLKSVFMRHAMGMMGDLPKLVQGEPL
jgi:2-octaprenyl-6-methoxyphenol hydroxylase